MRAWWAPFVALAALLAAAAATAGEAPRTLVLGSGEAAGMYLPEAGAICRVVNKERVRHGLRCLVEPSAGSAANLAALRNGEQQLAIVQSRVLAQAVQGSGAFAKIPGGDLRALMSLHGEIVALLVGPGGRVKTMADLKGKRVNLGRSGSFQRQTAEALLAAEGIAPADLAAGLDIDPGGLAKALCRNEVDAAFVTGLHPLPELRAALAGCAASLLPLKDAAIDKFLKHNPAYVRQSLTAETYPELRDNVPSLGLRAVLVTTAELPADQAYEVVRAVFDNLPAVKGMHPLLSQLDRRQMAQDGLVAPLHEGASRYYRDNRLP